MELRQIEINKLKTNKLQPKNRTTKRSLQGLKNNIARFKSGNADPIKVSRLIKGKYVIFDGHRRVEIMKSLGYDKIPALVYNGEFSGIDEITGFLMFNKDNRKLNAIDYLEAFLKGGYDIPRNIMSDIIFVIDTLGKKYLRYLLKKNISPYFPHRIYSAVKKIGLTELLEKNQFMNFCTWSIINKKFTFIRSVENGDIPKQELLKQFQNQT